MFTLWNRLINHFIFCSNKTTLNETTSNKAVRSRQQYPITTFFYYSVWSNLPHRPSYFFTVFIIQSYHLSHFASNVSCISVSQCIFLTWLCLPCLLSLSRFVQCVTLTHVLYLNLYHVSLCTSSHLVKCRTFSLCPMSRFVPCLTSSHVPLCPMSFCKYLIFLMTHFVPWPIFPMTHFSHDPLCPMPHSAPPTGSIGDWVDVGPCMIKEQCGKGFQVQRRECLTHGTCPKLMSFLGACDKGNFLECAELFRTARCSTECG